jgi:hypothetical protein
MTDDHFSEIVGRQYQAALKMLRGVIEKCPGELWDARHDEAPPWQQMLHVLFYTRLYLLPSIEGSDASENRAVALRLIGDSETKPGKEGRAMWSLTKHDYHPPRMATKQELIERLDKCEVALEGALLDIARGGGADPSPADWIKGDRAHLLLYNLRHIQHHVGRLHGTLGRRGVQLEWHG